MDENKKRRILFTAMRLFNENGFHGTPTSMIAKKSKVSVGTLFNYFPTKEELIHEIYMDIKKHSKSVFLELCRDCRSAHDTMSSMWSAIIKWGIDNPEEFNYLELFLHSPFKTMHLEDNNMRSYKKFRESIFQTISPSTICVKYPEFATIYVDNALHATIDFINNNDIDDLNNFILSSFDLLWNGFAQ